MSPLSALGSEDPIVKKKLVESLKNYKYSTVQRPRSPNSSKRGKLS